MSHNRIFPNGREKQPFKWQTDENMISKKQLLIMNLVLGTITHDIADNNY